MKGNFLLRHSYNNKKSGNAKSLSLKSYFLFINLWSFLHLPIFRLQNTMKHFSLGQASTKQNVFSLFDLRKQFAFGWTHHSCLNFLCQWPQQLLLGCFSTFSMSCTARWSSLGRCAVLSHRAGATVCITQTPLARTGVESAAPSLLILFFLLLLLEYYSIILWSYVLEFLILPFIRKKIWSFIIFLLMSVM